MKRKDSKSINESLAQCGGGGGGGVVITITNILHFEILPHFEYKLNYIINIYFYNSTPTPSFLKGMPLMGAWEKLITC